MHVQPLSPSPAPQRVADTDLSEIQVAEILGRSEATLRRWRRIGEGPAYRRLGGRITYPRQAIEDFLAKSVKLDA